MGQFDPKDGEGSHKEMMSGSGPGVVGSPTSQPTKYGELIVLG